MTTRELSLEQLEQLERVRRPRTAEEAEQAGETLRLSRDSTVSRIRLWDIVGERWTGPLEQGLAMAYTARKVAFKCTACFFTSILEGDVARHIKGVAEKHGQHRRAKLVTAIGRTEPAMECTGCSDIFLTRKRTAQRHLEQMVEAGPAHQGAQEQLIRRFSLEPSTPVSNGTGPVDIQVERSRRSRRRRRRRRGNR